MAKIEPITFVKEVEIVISPQAQKILSASNYTLEEFKEWALEDQKISLGGHNVVLFLESRYEDSD
jgi:hypothetical protein